MDNRSEPFVVINEHFKKNGKKIIVEAATNCFLIWLNTHQSSSIISGYGSAGIDSIKGLTTEEIKENIRQMLTYCA
jgi:hypothetical protein